ncbi:murein hydrolase activator EnvC family protein [Oxalobacter formigenes]|uniref:Peptidase, M23 family n=1 Tax=Oxalobacter formigenes OXCC13 TaxID=556269 RepID=C3XBT1_OXAFO|nr:peptidoglycan DD-metalloendopeptidase family protein [Oxalobacter formigenes]ARQ45174.1 Murein hydrolase activator EnvC [Oxalobacter formigenes]ARQ77477.1 protease [Oxalobacter formigenes OXCC13]EEO30657.1 peptidase, M23 family [Oxalobacter formigenes OXCC13]MCZ4062370.1 peptidoglycan DD-metalloendopeptidase family protein [Oxalobacter formigenes]WAW01868.1 peptidoglycan DD-metalloendopeptidase family protein [Oxalobacter formigenes]
MKKALFFLFLLVYATASSLTVHAKQKATSTKQQKQVNKKAASKRGKSKTTSKKAGDTARQKQAAETEQKKVHTRLNTLKKEIGKTEVAKGKASEALTQSQKAISTTERSLAELGQKKAVTENKLTQLSSEQAQLTATVAKQQKQLAKLMQQQYVSGGEDRMKLLFSGDNPNRISREMQYMNYYSTAYSQLIASLRQNIKAVDAKKSETKETKQELDKIASKTSEQKQVLEKEKARHAALVAQLSDKLSNQKKEAERLAQDEKRLGGLVDRLSRKIEEQRKAAEKRAAQARLAEQQARKQAKQSRQTKQARKTQSRPQKQESQAEIVRETPYKADTASAFGKKRGSLRMPVQGTITARYGMKRADGPSWKGIFIKTSAGAPVHSVAGGKVIFADTLRGFGRLIIIDHGDHYMTIYGNAQTLNKRVGDTVGSGETVATAGNSGENGETGLYFELRRSGHALNPSDWISTR